MHDAYMPRSQFFRISTESEDERGSLYYFLYQFLIRVPDYDSHKELTELFGDARSLSYEEWWDKFGEPAIITGEPVAVDFIARDQLSEAEKAGKAILFIDPKADFNSLMRDFLQVLSELGVDCNKNGVGRPRAQLEKERAIGLGTKFVLEHMPPVLRLQQALKARELADAGNDPAAIAKALGLDTYTKGDFEGQKKERRDAVESVRRALADYRSIIEGLSRPSPKFPVLPS